MTHLDYDLESSVWRHWLEGLAAGRTLVRYDERGCGLSDWNVEHFNFDDWVDDLELVVDAEGIERFPLLGVSQGAAVAVAFAARHPERVERLILASAYGRGRLARATTDDATPRGRARPGAGPGRLGHATTRRSARCSRRSSFPTAPASSGRRSTSSSGAPRRQPTQCASSRRSRASTSPARHPRALPHADAALPRRPAPAALGGEGAGRVRSPAAGSCPCRAATTSSPTSSRRGRSSSASSTASSRPDQDGSGWAPRTRRPGVAPVGSPSGRSRLPATKVCR